MSTVLDLEPSMYDEAHVCLIYVWNTQLAYAIVDGLYIMQKEMQTRLK